MQLADSLMAGYDAGVSRGSVAYFSVLLHTISKFAREFWKSTSGRDGGGGVGVVIKAKPHTLLPVMRFMCPR